MRRIMLCCLAVCLLPALLAAPAQAGVLDGVLGGVLGAPKPPPPKQDRFTCRASALRVNVLAPLISAEPVVANGPGDPCADDKRDLISVNLPPVAAVSVLPTETVVEPTYATADAAVATVQLNLAPALTVTAKVLTAHAEARCDPKTGAALLSGSSKILSLTVNGTEYAVGANPNATINGLPLVKIVVNEQIFAPGKITVRALHVSVPLLGTDVVVSEAIADVHGNPCPKPPPPPQCKDGMDNDKDGKTDHPKDPGCESPDDNDETDPPKPQCSDGKDNDGDKKIDYSSTKGYGDPECKDPYDNDEKV
jgi:hypothetical protein